MNILAKNFISYSIVGGFGTIVHYSFLISAVELIKSDPVLTSIIASFFGATTNYYLNKTFTYQSSRRHIEIFPIFMVTATLGFFVNAFSMYICVKQIHLSYIFAQLISTGAVLLFGFFLNHYWTFKEIACDDN